MSGPVRRLLRLARPAAPRLVIASLAGAAAAVSGIGLTATAAWLIARAAEHPPVLDLGVAVVAVRAFGLSRGFLRYGERLAGHDAALRVLARLRVRAFERLARTVPAGDRCARGDLLSRFASDVDASVDVLVRAGLPYAAALLAGGAAVALSAGLLPAAGAALAVMVVVGCFVVPVVQHVGARRADRRLAPLRGELAGSTVDFVVGLADLTAYGAAEARLARLAATQRRLHRLAGRSSATVGAGAALLTLAGGGCVVATLVLAIPQVRAGRLPGVLLAVAGLTPLAVLEVVAGLPAAAAQFGVARTALRRVFAVTDRPEPAPDPDSAAPLPAPPYHLRVEDAGARWRPDGPEVFSGLSLDLPPGRRVALVGPSGCGKTTLASLLVRFLDPDTGRVTLNGVDLRDLAGDAVRRVVGLVTDDAYCFDTTIEGNLRVGRPGATIAQLRAALRAARLLDWVESLPLGLATPVGEHGGQLSGGQRRRLALARALLADFPILVLDEPTEHLDDATAAALTADLLAATAGRSALLITHRPFGLDQVDEVVVLVAPEPESAETRCRKTW